MTLEFSSLEKKSIVKVLFDMVNADGMIAVGEVKYFDQICNLLSLSKSDLKEALRISVAESISILKRMTKIKKDALVIMMLEMMRADGDIDKKEWEVFAAVCILAEIELPENK